jgi:acyl-CoA thioester hydrolase
MYFRYLEEAEHAMWRAAGLSIAPRDEDIGFPRVSASMEYRAPLRFDDEIDVTIRIEKMSARSIRYAGTITRAGAAVASGVMTTVCVERTTMQSRDLPTDVVARLGQSNKDPHPIV